MRFEHVHHPMNAISLAIGLALAAPAVMLGASTANASGTGPAMAAYPPFWFGEPARHIILFIGDGMHLQHEMATSRYLFGRDQALSFQRLPYRGNVATWDVTTYNRYASAAGKSPYTSAGFDPRVGYDFALGGKLPYPLQIAGVNDAYFLGKINGKEPATDSASAGTAIAAGVKTDDGNIAWLPTDPADGAIKTVAESLREELGMAIGVVSTVPFSHATPAAFVSHNVSRNNYHAIANEILTAVKPEVVIGGGHPMWAANSSGEGVYMSKALLDAVRTDPDYVVVERKSGADGINALLAGADEAVDGGNKLFGIFGGSGGNFESPVPRDLPAWQSVRQGTAENPLLQDTVVAALKVLSQDPDGFFVMFEQGDIDWANHENNFSRMVGTTWDLHEAVKAAIRFVDEPDDDIHWGNTLLVVTSDHSNSYLRLNPDEPLVAGDLPKQTRNSGGASGGYAGAYVYPDGEVTYGTGNHTNELVRLYAAGVGASQFRAFEGTWYPCTRIVDNTQIYHTLMAAAGVPGGSSLTPTVTRPASCTP